eukprot:768344-Hanusia_phi.AAC.8
MFHKKIGYNQSRACHKLTSLTLPRRKCSPYMRRTGGLRWRVELERLLMTLPEVSSVQQATSQRAVYAQRCESPVVGPSLTCSQPGSL